MLSPVLGLERDDRLSPLLDRRPRARKTPNLVLRDQLRVCRDYLRLDCRAAGVQDQNVHKTA